MNADKMTESDSTYFALGSTDILSLSNKSISHGVSSLISVVSILILLLLSEGNILLGIIS